MKPIVFFLFFLSILVLPLYAQEDTMIQKMVEFGLINSAESKLMTQCASGDQSTMKYLLCLLYLQAQKSRTQNSEGAITNKSQDDRKPKSKDELIEYIEKLKRVGLIKVGHFKKLEKEILNGKHRYYKTLIASITKMHEHIATLSPEFLSEFSESMLKAQLMTKASFEKLIQDAKTGEIYYPSQILTYMSDTKLVQYSSLSPDFGFRLETLFRETASILPELEFTDFCYSFKVLTKQEDYAEDTLVVSLKNRGKTYTSIINYSELGEHLQTEGILIEENYYHIFNNILADHQSPLRINSMELEAEIFSDPLVVTYGLLLLNHAQCELMQRTSTPFRFHRAGYKNCLTETKKDNLLQKLDSLGVLEYLTADQKSALSTEIRKEDYFYYSEIFAAIPDMLYLIPTEYHYSDQAHAEKLANLERISHGAYNPKDIKITENPSSEEKDKLLEFSFKGKMYKVECLSLPKNGPSFDNDLYQFINKVLEEHQNKGKFYYMNTINGEEGTAIIYLTPDQYEYLKANKFASFDIFNPDPDHHYELDDRY